MERDWDDDAYDDDGQPYDTPEDCCHEDYDADFNGRATCYRCGYTWWQSAAEIDREIRHQSDYDAYIRREMLKETWWGRIVFGLPDWLKSRWHSFILRTPKQELSDDDIPF